MSNINLENVKKVKPINQFDFQINIFNELVY